MKRNMGSIDRTIRFLVAILFGVLYYNEIITGTLGIILVLLAVILFLTSFVGYCPLYTPFGISTCKPKTK